uniref:Monoacylglycerol lipase ABHD12-like isoform X1 n=2 Tax=Hirondellea gigas TaxID=1518452 RepID=A0A6A7G6N1_9CRUS
MLPIEMLARRIKYKLLHGHGISRVHLLSCCGFLITLLLTLAMLAPIIFYFSPSVQDYLIFKASTDFAPELASPGLLGLHNTRSFYITTPEGIKLGAWHILPTAAAPPSGPETIVSRGNRFERELGKEGSVVVVYYHGNKPSRAMDHRVQLYKLLANIGCHVFAFDYRSYADSSVAELTEEGLVMDGVAAYDYVKSRTGPGTAVLLWGHSLGTGVASSVAASLCSRGGKQHCADGLVIHSGFTDLLHAVLDSKMAMNMRWVPWFEPLIAAALSSRKLQLNTRSSISRVSCPVLILHAQDDVVIPLQHARLLQSTATARNGAGGAGGVGPGGAGGVTYVEFSGDLGYGHNHIVNAPELTSIVSEYIQHCREYHQAVEEEQLQQEIILLPLKQHVKQLPQPLRLRIKAGGQKQLRQRRAAFR